MDESKKHTVSLQRTCHASKETMLNLFRDNTIFRLTGADQIQSDFKANGPFHLTFENRGTIHGKFIEITGNEIILEWNVEGFNRPLEDKTIVEITLIQQNDKCIVNLNHKNIPTSESAAAKKRAWTEILDEIEKMEQF